MDVDFADEDMERLEADATFTAGFSQSIVTKYRERMQLIRAAPDERDFYALKSLNFKQGKGALSHLHSMRLNKQWRLYVEFRGKKPNKKVRIVEIDDKH